jgi:presenilin-like A22 family membrane protease
MKHSLKIILILITMFFIAQLIGIAVTYSYNQFENTRSDQKALPEFISPPKDISPQSSLSSIIIAIGLGVLIMLGLMSLKAEMFLRIWFFLVIIIAMSISINSVLMWFSNYHFILSLAFSLPLAFIKVFIRNIKVHNLTELIIYPGVASLFIVLLNIWTVSVLLILISIYDIYAVWHAGFMQKMAKYQIKQLKIFSGFFIPYVNKTEIKNSKNSKNNKVKASVAILGGGDIVFPIILAGTVFIQFGIISAIIIAIGATMALATLFYYSEKGKFYPAMPFISAGCFIALGIVYLINYIW